MAKDPAFLFYYDRFLSGTISMTDTEVGQYVRLMCIQANKGFITKKDMLHICKTYDNEVCLKFMNIGPDKFANAVLTEIMKQRQAFTESRRNNRKGKKSTNTSETHDKHVVNVNVDKDVSIKIQKEQIPKLQLFEQLFADELYIGELSRAHPKKDLKQAFEEMYLHHSQGPNILEPWQWRQKFNTWLTIKGDKKNGNSKVKQSSSDLAEAFANRVSSDLASGGFQGNK